jgi:hypothetical protein
MPERSASRRKGTVPYRIVIKGEIGAAFVGPLEGVKVESVAAESSLRIDILDQSHLQGVIQALSDRGIEIISLDVVGESQ